MIQYIRTPNFEETILDDEWVILNTDNHSITRLNDIGGFCWTLLSEPQTFKSIMEAIHQEYDIQDQSIEEDIQRFLEDLIECGLIRDAE
ncbi:PqqD family protein [Caldalkalibacillus mannanilyticus]|uniref:PqqD family protein n=1 Tax=Caldalkalibacillus mannanilyticus TaxID=1418 RepID=UPI00046A5026|nr:PqqD family protein [Caldalkalibacillus mannanilyticus]